MKFKRTLTAVVLAAAVVGSSAACSTRRIDPETTNSVHIKGTSWEMFCDGPNAFIWVPGHSGDADELEAVIYDHYACKDAPGAVVGNPAHRDLDGVFGNDDEDN